MATPTTNRTTKSPAFQFYPKDFLSSSKVQRMSLTEIGVYTLLLAHCWLDNGLPSDIDQIAKLVKMTGPRFRKLWEGPLSECFYYRGNRLFNARLEHEYAEQLKWRAKQTANGKMGGRPRNPEKAVGYSGLTQTEPRKSSSSPSSSSTKNKEKKEVSDDTSPIVLTFPTNGDPDHWDLRESQVAKWTEAYPGLTVTAECRRALAWIEANHQKTARGMASFLVRWLGNATNRGGAKLTLAATGTEGRGRTGAAPRGKYDGIEEGD